jgi:hypothetical protein
MRTSIYVAMFGLVSGALLHTGCAASEDEGTTDPIPEDRLLDDLEDGDSAIPEEGTPKRIGAWFSYADGTAGGTLTPAESGDFVPAEGGPGDSMYYASLKGKGWKEWGAGMGFDFNNTGEPDIKKAWDASAYTGIQFTAKGNTTMRVAVMTLAVVPVAQGGECPEPPVGATDKDCDDGHGKSLTLTSDWKTYQIKFEDLKQEGGNLTAAFDAAKAASIQFDVGPNLDFEIAVDNVGFY